MKEIKLGSIPTFQFNNKLIISIDQRWIKYLGSNEPTFQTIIKDGNLVLVGPKITTRPTKRKHHHVEEDASVIA